jgi:hypothetical protein
VNRRLLVEGRARDQLARKWTEFPSSDVRMRYSGVGGGAYTDLLTCLVMELNVGNLRAGNGFIANHNVPIDN